MRSELTQLEKDFWNAGGNPNFWRQHFADDGVIALAMGLMDKQTVVDAQESAQPWEAFDLKDVRVMEIRNDVGSVSYQATARRAGDEADYVVVVSSVYVRRKGEWQLIVHQQTPVA